MNNRNKLILIAEDSPTQAVQLKYMLEQHKYIPHVVNNGNEALEYLKNHKPLLIISDILMPEMDGYEFCKRIKSDEKLKKIPVILLTALNEPRDIIKGLQVGADSFIRKPYDERYLIARINYILTNMELRKNEKVQLGMEISLGGERHFITSERQQMLDLLISTYEQAVNINGELKRSYNTLDGLYNISQSLNKCMNAQEVVEKALYEGMKLPGIKAGWILLKEHNGNSKLVAKKGLPPELDTPQFFEGDCHCWRKLLTGELDRVTNILECERLQKSDTDKHGMLYHASVPLWSGDDTLGVMNLVGSERNLFTNEELDTFFAVGNQIGTALERARLIKSLEQLVKERTSALLETEIWFRTVFNSQKDAVFVISKERKIINMNSAAEEMFGYALKEVQNQSTEVLHLDKEHFDKFGVNIFESYDKGQAARFEFQLKKKNGEIFPSEHTVSFIDDESGNLTGIVSVVRDITERKRAEESLRKTQQRLSVVIDNVPVILFALNKEGIFTLSEGKGLEKLGFKSGEVVGQSVFDLYRGNSDILKHISRALNGEECSFIAESSGLAFDTRYFPLKDEEGNCIGLYGAAFDITERKRAEAERERAEKILHLLSNAMQSVNECVSITDENDNLIFVNEAFEKTYDYTQEELQGRPMTTFRSERNPKEVVDAILPATLKGGWQGEIFNKRKDGTEFPIWLSTSLVKDKDGKFIALIGVARDITMQKKAEGERNRLIAILESTSDFVGMADKDGRSLYLNRGGRKLLGIDEKEDLTGFPIILGHPQSIRPFIMNEVLPKAAQDGIWSGETALLHRDGHEVPVLQIMIAHKSLNGEVELYSTIARDITERKAIEEELIAAKDKAEESDKLKSEFLAQMSHEIRTPINIVIGNINFIKEELEEKSSLEYSEVFDGVEHASKRIIRTVDLILNMSEIQTGAYKVVPTEIDIHTQILANLVTEYQQLAKNKNLELIYECKAKHTICNVDEYSVNQIFVNLIDNAIKYTKHGKVEILFTNSKVGELVVEIKDTGIGMSEEFQEHLFEPFVQEEQGYSRSYEGNGLGLALVKKYCDLNNARVEVESKKNVGSTFRVIISV